MGIRQKREYLIGFNMINQIGPRRIQSLISHFSNLESAWKASYRALLNVPSFGPKLAQHVVESRKRIDPVQEIIWAKEHDAKIATIYDQDYPSCLRELATPPPVIYYRGHLPYKTGVSIVGSRKASLSGRKQAYHFGSQLGASGIPIISGLARGIDTEAHRGALASGGSTIAVLATPINQIYPPENHSLAEEIVSSGCLITEYSSLSQTKPGNFPQRNRLIAALAQVILVVEASLKSGSLSTVDSGLELGRDIWAIPGDISHPLRQGTNALIKQGAGLCDNPEDILTLFPQPTQSQPVPSDDYAQNILKLYHLGCSIDEIIERLNLPVQEVQHYLTVLEIGGLLGK